MKMQKFFFSKGQGLSMSTIVVILLALIIIILVIAMITSKTRFFSKETSSCLSRGGGCVASVASCPGVTYRGTDCTTLEGVEGPICCVRVEETS